jgi:hypothetical protein
MLLACLFGYIAVGVSFYLYVTRTAQIEPDLEAELTSAIPTLTLIATESAADVDRKAA